MGFRAVEAIDDFDALPLESSPRRPQRPFSKRDRRPIIFRAKTPPLAGQSSGNAAAVEEGTALDPRLDELLKMPLMVPILEQYEKAVKAQIDPILRDINAVKRYRRSPLLFWRDVLGISIDVWRDDRPPRSWKLGDPVPLWSKQREVIQAVVDHRKVAVKAGLGVGKTFIAGGLALYLAYVWHCVGLTTASTFRQVRRALWGEIHWLFNNAREPLGGKLNQVSLDLGDKWFVEGFATDKPMTNITGIHEENVFVIVDEAHGVPDLSFEALEGIITSENSFVLYVGNAINPHGPFAEAFRPNSKFYKITISCYDVPNVKFAQTIYPKLTSYQWVRDKEVRWGRDSALFKGWVLGEFPEESKDSLIPLHLIDAALRKGKDGEVVADEVMSFGLDVARQGSDSSVFGAMYKSGLFRILDATKKTKETETAGRMKVLYDQLIPKPLPPSVVDRVDGRVEAVEEDRPLPPINVDDIGVGGGVVDMLEEDGYPVNGINVAESPDLNDEETDHPELFLNRRAQYYWKVRKRFMDGTIAIEDDELAFELSKIRVEYLRSGKIKIIDKDTLRKPSPIGIGRSPDKAECLMLACARSEAESNREMVRFVW